MLVVDDGKWVTDPNAKIYADDGFGSRNAVLYINKIEDKNEILSL